MACLAWAGLEWAGLAWGVSNCEDGKCRARLFGRVRNQTTHLRPPCRFHCVNQFSVLIFYNHQQLHPKLVSSERFSELTSLGLTVHLIKTEIQYEVGSELLHQHFFNFFVSMYSVPN